MPDVDDITVRCDNGVRTFSNWAGLAVFITRTIQFRNTMPARVRIPHRIVAHIAVPVQALRVARIGHDGVRLDEAPERRVIVAGIVEVQADGVVATLARNEPHARQPGPQRENTAVAPDAAGAAGVDAGARAWTLRWGDYGRRGGKNLWSWEGAGERWYWILGIEKIVARNGPGRNRPVHGPPFCSPEASAPGGRGRRRSHTGWMKRPSAGSS